MIRLRTVYLSLSLACTILTAAEAPATLVETRFAIEKVKSEIAREEEIWAKEKQDAGDAEASRTKRYETFSREEEQVRESVARLESDIQTELEKIETLKRSEVGYENRFSRLMDILEAKAQELRALVKASLPYREEKRNQVANLLVRDIKGGRISPEEGFNRLWILYENEHQLAGESEVFESAPPGEPEGESVRYLRLGKVLLLYASRDGQRLGYLSRDADGGRMWINQDAMDLREREAVRQALATAEGALQPGFRPVPVPGISLRNRE